MDQLLRALLQVLVVSRLSDTSTTDLVRWAMRKYKRLHGHLRRAKRWLASVARRDPRLFAHWHLVRPDGWTMGAG